MKLKALLVLLLVLFSIDQFFIAQESFASYRIFTKPLLLPLITWIYYLKTKNNCVLLNNAFVLGLLFSFLGDLLLLFDWGLLPGLGSFLIAHICYIISFRRAIRGKKWFFIPFILVYLGLLLYYLFPHLAEMKVPVILYGMTISTMLWFSFRTERGWLVMGALLFVTSDSLLAVNLFVKQSELFSLLVMITYFLAQLALVQGVSHPNFRVSPNRVRG